MSESLEHNARQERHLLSKEMPITLFSLPKAFRGHVGVIQRNAIHSWTRLYSLNEIILFGDDDGTADIAAEFGLRHIPDIERNEYGTPLIHDMFAKAQQLARYSLLCYVNADIILMSNFMQAIQDVRAQHEQFLMVGQRWNLDLRELVDFGAGWEEQLRTRVQQQGRLQGIYGIDYFVFTPEVFGEIPPFAIGRSMWDNWLIYRARSHKMPVIDATERVMIVHQNHDYAHMNEGKNEAFGGVEAKRNHQLAGTETYFSLHDATHVLKPQSLYMALDTPYVWQRLNKQTVLNRFIGQSRFRRALLRGIIWIWKFYLICTPASQRHLLYNWLQWTEGHKKEKLYRGDEI